MEEQWRSFAVPITRSTTAPAVDAEMLVDGHRIAVEVTGIASRARSHAEIERVTRRVAAGVQAIAPRFPSAHVLVDADFGTLPQQRTIRAAEPTLVADSVAEIALLDPQPNTRQEVTLATSVPFVRRLRLIALPQVEQGLGWLTGADDWGGWIEVMADEFVDHLLGSKPAQTAPYAEAWVVAVDRDGLLEAKDIRASLLKRAKEVPGNWSRVWVLPATDASTVMVAWPPGCA